MLRDKSYLSGMIIDFVFLEINLETVDCKKKKIGRNMSKKPKIKWVWYGLLIACLSNGLLEAKIEGTAPNHLMNPKIDRNSLAPYLLSESHPLHAQLMQLFSDPALFQSAKNLKKAGFTVQFGHPRTRLMVGGHSLIPQYLLKKFPDDISQTTQLKNFVKRIRGAEVLRNCIKKHHFTHLVVPEKWLVKLPKGFPKNSYVLVVEKMNIYDDGNDPKGKTRELYYNLDRETLTELCTLLHEVGGCDSLPRNMPFTYSGQIALIDTEHVGTEKTKEQFHRDTIPLLNNEMQAYAIALWEKLENDHKKKN